MQVSGSYPAISFPPSQAYRFVIPIFGDEADFYGGVSSGTVRGRSSSPFSSSSSSSSPFSSSSSSFSSPSGIHPESRFLTRPRHGDDGMGEDMEEDDDEEEEDEEEEEEGGRGGGGVGGGESSAKLLKKLNFRLGRLQKRIFKLIKESAIDFREEKITTSQAQR